MNNEFRFPWYLIGFIEKAVSGTDFNEGKYELSEVVSRKSSFVRQLKKISKSFLLDKLTKGHNFKTKLKSLPSAAVSSA